MPDRTYTEREIAAILARAAAPDRPDAGGPGLTLDEIERAAAESGLDPARVRRAAADLDAGLLEAAASRPGTVLAERWAEGGVSEAAWEDAVAALRLRVGAPAGGADTAARSEAREWTHTSPFDGTTTVTVSPRGGRTRVRVVWQDAVGNARTQATALGALASLVVGMLAGALVAEGLGFGDVWGVVAVLVVLAAGTAAISETLTRRTLARRDERARDAERLADDLVRMLGLEAPDPTAEVAPRAAAGPPAPEPPAEARIDAGLLDDEAEGPDVEARRSRGQTRA